jgi:hypothetical protein
MAKVRRMIRKATSNTTATGKTENVTVKGKNMN